MSSSLDDDDDDPIFFDPSSLPEDFDSETFSGYFEVSGSTAPGEAGFSSDGGKATMQFLVRDEELNDFILDVLGDTEYESGPGGRVQRRLPMAHPRWPHLYGRTAQASFVMPKLPPSKTGTTPTRRAAGVELQSPEA